MVYRERGDDGRGREVVTVTRRTKVVDGVETRSLIDANLPYAQVLEEYTPGGGSTARAYS